MCHTIKQVQCVHTSIDSSGGREPSAAGSVKVGSNSVDEGCLLSGLVLSAAGVTEFRTETGEETGFLRRLRFL